MTDNDIIKHLNSISDLLAAISVGTGASSVTIGYHTDMNEDNRYSLVMRDCSWKGPTGWGPTPAEAFANLRKQEAIAAQQDAITAKVEQYRRELEKGFEL